MGLRTCGASSVIRAFQAVRHPNLAVFTRVPCDTMPPAHSSTPSPRLALLGPACARMIGLIERRLHAWLLGATGAVLKGKGRLALPAPGAATARCRRQPLWRTQGWQGCPDRQSHLAVVLQSTLHAAGVAAASCLAGCCSAAALPAVRPVLCVATCLKDDTGSLAAVIRHCHSFRCTFSLSHQQHVLHPDHDTWHLAPFPPN